MCIRSYRAGVWVGETLGVGVGLALKIQAGERAERDVAKANKPWVLSCTDTVTIQSTYWNLSYQQADIKIFAFDIGVIIMLLLLLLLLVSSIWAIKQVLLGLPDKHEQLVYGSPQIYTARKSTSFFIISGRPWGGLAAAHGWPWVYCPVPVNHNATRRCIVNYSWSLRKTPMK